MQASVLVGRGTPDPRESLNESRISQSATLPQKRPTGVIILVDMGRLIPAYGVLRTIQSSARAEWHQQYANGREICNLSCLGVGLEGSSSLRAGHPGA